MTVQIGVEKKPDGPRVQVREVGTGRVLWETPVEERVAGPGRVDFGPWRRARAKASEWIRRHGAVLEV